MPGNKTKIFTKFWQRQTSNNLINTTLYMLQTVKCYGERGRLEVSEIVVFGQRLEGGTGTSYKAVLGTSNLHVETVSPKALRRYMSGAFQEQQRGWSGTKIRERVAGAEVLEVWRWGVGLVDFCKAFCFY